MDRTDVVKIEIEKLSGEALLDVNLELRMSEFTGRIVGSKMTWTAAGLRLSLPLEFFELHREEIVRLLDRAKAGVRNS